MAIYHLSASTISRGKGQSAVASSAYRSGDKLYSERYGETSYYVRKVKPVTFILKPDHAPAWTLNRQQLWNEVEKVEKSSNAQLAREFNIALPVELSDEAQEKLVKEYVQENFVNRGMVADVAIHRDDKANPHFHLMVTMRPFNQDGTWGAKAKRIFILDENGNQLYYESGDKKSRKENLTDWNSKETFAEWRENWAKTANRYLADNGYSERITDKSYAEQGLDIEPTIHEGYVARKMEKQGNISDRCEENRAIKKRNMDKSRTDYVVDEKVKNISASLSPQEKKELTSIAKNLKVYVTYDVLIDKERMLNNWKQKLVINTKITDNDIDPDTLSKVAFMEKNVDQAKEILEKQANRIVQKYYNDYPNIEKIPTYMKLQIAKETIEKNDVLTVTEFKQATQKANDNRLTDMLKVIVKNPYIKPIEHYAKQAIVNKNQLTIFEKTNDLTSLDKDQVQTYTRLQKAKSISENSVAILDKYYTENIQYHYPTFNTDNITTKEKEALSKAIDYYGNDFEANKLHRIMQGEQVNKFTTAEQHKAIDMLLKLKDNRLSDEEMNDIKNDYRASEMYRVLTNKDMTRIFVDEISHNKVKYHYDDVVNYVRSYSEDEAYDIRKLNEQLETTKNELRQINNGNSSHTLATAGNGKTQASEANDMTDVSGKDYLNHDEKQAFEMNKESRSFTALINKVDIVSGILEAQQDNKRRDQKERKALRDMKVRRNKKGQIIKGNSMI